MKKEDKLLSYYRQKFPEESHMEHLKRLSKRLEWENTKRINKRK